MPEGEEVLVELMREVAKNGGVYVDGDGEPVTCVMPAEQASAILARYYTSACRVFGDEEVTRRQPKQRTPTLPRAARG